MKRKFSLLLVLTGSLLLATAALAEEDGRFERTLNVTGAPQVEVNTGSGNISVHTGDSATVRVIGHIHAGHGLFWGKDMDKVHRIESNPPIEQTGSIIKIGRITDPDLRRNIAIDFEVWVPDTTTLRANSGSGDVMVENLKNSVTAGTGSGNVQVRHIQSDVRANTGSGDITLEDITGNVNADTGSGNVKVAMSGAGALRLGTGSGDVTVDNARGAVKVHTGSGNIRVNGDVTSDWTMETGSGDVSIQLPQNARFDLAASTGSGDIHVAREITVSGNINPHRMRGKVNGGGPLLQFQTSSGNIELR